MRPTPKLTLKKESLTELTGSELRLVAAGQDNLSGITCPIRDCVVSLFADCVTYSCLCTTTGDVQA